jgi:hypothetical protein
MILSINKPKENEPRRENRSIGNILMPVKYLNLLFHSHGRKFWLRIDSSKVKTHGDLQSYLKLMIVSQS